MNISFLIRCFSAAMAVCVISPAWAGDDEPEGCKVEVEQFCSDVQPGGGRIEQCLRQHQDELSKACKAHRRELGNELQDFSKVCKKDIAAHCAEVEPGGGRILRCLKEHQAELAAECAARIQEGVAR